MLLRAVFLFIVTTSLMQAESNTTIQDEFPTEYSSDSKQSLDLMTAENSKSSEETNSSNIIDHSIKTDGNQSVMILPRDDDNSSVNTDSNRSKDINSALDLLEGYDGVTAAGVLQSEPESVDANVTSIDENSSNLISSTTKLDDVSNLDIVKAQRKQRKIEREEAKKVEEVEGAQAHPLVDTIVVKGSVLQGQIDQLTSEYISFRLIYGEGSIRIKYSDVESLVTEHEYHIYFDGKETVGYITEIQDHAFLKIQHGEVEELITIAKIDRFIVSEHEDPSFENKLRNTFPYWSGNLDLGIEYESGSNEKRKAKIGGHIERTRTIHKTIFDITYSYEQTQTVDTPTVLNKHEIYAFLEQNYAFTKSDFIFGEIGYDFDVPRGVDGRIYPSLGYGYKIQADKRRWIQFKVGGGYVHETFIDYDSNAYAAGVFAADMEYEVRDLPILNRMLLGASFFYMPGIEDLTNNWLLRYSITASIPFSKALALKMVTRQVTDDNPSPEVGNNKLTFDLYLSILF